MKLKNKLYITIAVCLFLGIILSIKLYFHNNEDNYNEKKDFKQITEPEASFKSEKSEQKYIITTTNDNQITSTKQTLSPSVIINDDLLESIRNGEILEREKK